MKQKQMDKQGGVSLTEKKYGFLNRLLSVDYRSDGRLVRNLGAAQQIMPYLMKSRCASSIFLKETFDLTRTMDYIKKNNENPTRYNLSVFIVLLAALVRTGVFHPRLNRFVVGRRIYARNKLQASYLLKDEFSETGRDLMIKQTFEPTDTLGDVAVKVNGALKKTRREGSSESDSLIKSLLKLPGFILALIFFLENALNNRGLLPKSLMNADPLFSSAFVANLGSLELNAPFHHLYERGTVSLFVVMGKYSEAGDPAKDQKCAVDITFTIDERITGGYFIAAALKSLKAFLENPELLEKPPGNMVEDPC